MHRRIISGDRYSIQHRAVYLFSSNTLLIKFAFTSTGFTSADEANMISFNLIILNIILFNFIHSV